MSKQYLSGKTYKPLVIRVVTLNESDVIATSDGQVAAFWTPTDKYFGDFF